jgi:hypothetical protein
LSFFEVDFGVDVDFWGRNWVGDVKMQRLGKIGKIKTSEKRQKL